MPNFLKVTLRVALFIACLGVTAFANARVAWTETGSIPLQGLRESLSQTISVDSTKLATVHQLGIKIRALPSGSELFMIPFGLGEEGSDFHPRVKISPDSKRLAFMWHDRSNSSRNRLEVWNLETREKVFAVTGQFDSNYYFSENATRMIVRTAEGSGLLLDGTSGAVVTTLQESNSWFNAGTKGNIFVGYQADQNISRIYNFNTGTLLFTVQGRAMEFSPDGNKLGVYSAFHNENAMSVWSVETGTLLSTWNTYAPQWNYFVALYDSSVFYQHLSQGQDRIGILELRNTETGQVLWSKERARSGFTYLSVSPDKSELLALEESTFPNRVDVLKSMDPQTGHENQVIFQVEGGFYDVKISNVHFLSQTKAIFTVQEDGTYRIVIIEKQ